MQVRHVTQEDIDSRVEYQARRINYTSDNESILHCQAIAGLIEDVQVTMVPWVFNEIELAELANGKTLWLTVVGGLPPHFLSVE